MSVESRHFAIVCDGIGCHAESEPRFETSLSPNEYAEEICILHGWTHEVDADYCPKCSQERALASSAKPEGKPE